MFCAMGNACARCCRCCGSSKVEGEDKVPEVDVAGMKRKCTDVLCLVFFIVFWLGMLAVAVIGIQYGEPKRLVYGKDYTGKTCAGPDSPGSTLNGCGDGSCSVIYYPKLSEDLLVAASQGTTDPTEVQLTGVCLPSCPTKNSVVCLYDYEDKNGRPDITFLRTTCRTLAGRALYSDMCSSCWPVDLDTDNVLFRCIWKEERSETVRERCTSPNSTFDKTDADYIDPNSNECATKETLTNRREEEPSQDVLAKQLSSWVAMFNRFMADIQNAKWVIVITGGVGAMVVAFGFILFMRKFAGCVVWAIILTLLVLLAGLTLYSYVQSGRGSLGEFGNVTSSVDLAGFGDSSPTSNRAAWDAAFYVLAFITVAYLVAVLALSKRIRQAIALIKEASGALSRMPGLIALPVPIVLVVTGVAAYWVVIAAYVASSESISGSDIAKSASEASVSVGGGERNVTVPAEVEDQNLVQGLFAYHFFGLLWTNAFLQGIGTTAIAGAVAHWYFTRPEATTNSKDIGRFPIAAAVGRTLRYHLGSIAFGSLVVAIVQFARAVLAYVDRQTREWQNRNAVLRIMFKVVQCCLWCFEKVLKFITRNAYIVVAVEGKSFCSAAIRSFRLIISNLALIGTVNAISMFVMILGKTVTTVAAGIGAFVWFSYDPSFEDGGANEISGYAVPVLIVVIVAYMIASLFMGVYDLTIDSLLLCFCMDVEKFKQSPEQLYAPRSLRRTLGIKGDVTKVGATDEEEEEEEEADTGAGEAKAGKSGQQSGGRAATDRGDSTSVELL